MLLTQPLAVGSFVLHNRLVMPPMATEKSEGEGKVSPALCSYYDEKTQGGYFGLVITEHSYINKIGQASVGQVSFACDEDVEGLAKVVDVIHANGSKVIAQVNHAGGKSISALDGKTTTPAPSAMHYVTIRGEEIDAHAVSQAEIDQLIADFVAAGRRAKAAGFDGVEIHSAHGYLLNQFFSPLFNKRTDAYTGETIEGRTRLHRQVIEAVRKEVGPEFVVAIRLGACDYLDGGSTIEDAVEACKIFEEAGVDLLDITGGMCGYRGNNSNFIAESQAVHNAVSVPVIVTGGVRSGSAAEQLLEAGVADLIGVGRPVLKDSSWARKAFEELGVTQDLS